MVECDHARASGNGGGGCVIFEIWKFLTNLFRDDSLSFRVMHPVSGRGWGMRIELPGGLEDVMANRRDPNSVIGESSPCLK